MQFTVCALRHMELATLVLDAADPTDARKAAEAQGYAVVSVRRQRPGVLQWHARFPLVQFSQSLLTLLEAGLSLVESIEALAEREARADVRQIFTSLLRKLHEGQSLSAALAAHPSAFPPLYIATIRANERTGGLTEAIERFIRYRHQIDLLKKRIVSAAIYPSLILCVGGLVILFLMLYVIPRFSQVFDDLGDQIPYFSKLLLEWGHVVHAHALWILWGALAAPLGAAYLCTLPAVRGAIGRALTRIPRMGTYLRLYQLARFYRTLGMLLRGGIPIMSALEMVLGLLPVAFQSALERARGEIREGQALSTAFDAHQLSNPVALRMLRVGERTGQMGEMMERIAGFFDDEVSEAIDWFIRLIEPLLMIVIGIVIGAIVLAMYAPIFELAGSIQ